MRRCVNFAGDHENRRLVRVCGSPGWLTRCQLCQFRPVPIPGPTGTLGEPRRNPNAGTLAVLVHWSGKARGRFGPSFMASALHGLSWLPPHRRNRYQ